MPRNLSLDDRKSSCGVALFSSASFDRRIVLYKRDFGHSDEFAVKHGEPQFGTFELPPKNLNVKGIFAPFGRIPLPRFLTNFRVHSRVSASFCGDEFCAFLRIVDSRICAFAEINVWNFQEKTLQTFRRVSFPFKRIVSTKTDDGKCVFLRRGFHLRFFWKDGNVKIFAKTLRKKKAFFLSFSLPNNEEKSSQVSCVLPQKVRKRCTAIWQKTGVASGSIKNDCQKINGDNCFSFFELRSSYYDLFLKRREIVGFGFSGGRRVVFHLSQSSQRAGDEDEFNENFLFVDNKTWTLPPVKITASDGIEKTWVIQDTESMVDLSFVPDVGRNFFLSALVLHANSRIQNGKFSGFLLTNEGETIFANDFVGIAENLRLRS